MQPFELVGPSYTSQSPNLADQLTMNLYVESSEGEGQSPAALYGTPGLKLFSNLANTPVRGQILINDRAFAVAGAEFFEVFSDGTFHNYGTVVNDGMPVSMAGGVSQILIASAGNVYVFDLSTGHITATTIAGGGMGYALNDTGTIVGGTISATYIITSVGAGGVVTGYTLTAGGAGYTVSSVVPTATGGAQPGVGTAFTVNITTVVTTNTFTALVLGTLLGPISFVAYVEGFFLALLANSDQFQWSAPLDATTWDPLDTNKVSVFAGNVLSMFADHNELWFWGERQSQPYYLSGGPNTFDPVPGGFIEAGIFAPNSPVRLDNSIFWLGGDERGAGVVWRANGYTPARVSNHAIEFALQGYLTKYGAAGLNNVVGYSYQDQGHGFYVLYFPSASATWVYDVATGMWHQRGYWNSATAMFTAHLSQNHIFAFGKHLVGDWSSGKIYDMNISYYDDAGNAIRRVRRARHASSDQSWVFHKTLQIYVETGVGPIPPLQGGIQLLTIPLADSGGTIWTVGITNIGLLTTTNSGPGIAGDFFLNDPTNMTSWQVGVTTLGLLTTTAVAFNPLNPSAVLLANGTVAYELTVTIGGLLQTTQNLYPFPRDPQLNIRWSNDGGHTWSNELSAGIGQAGNYGQRVMFRRLGRARNRVYELSASDPVPYRIVGAFLDVSAGPGA